LIQKAKTTADQAQRTQLYEQAQVIFHDQVPWLPIAHSVEYQAIRKSVLNYVITPVRLHDFRGVDIAE
ncbi:MAG TPA: ABC transporter substrate-binding protein, partial [Inquilinus sp.]|nr:ABC transporter substrate-binding protein [Inquilinus sp.]